MIDARGVLISACLPGGSSDHPRESTTDERTLSRCYSPQDRHDDCPLGIINVVMPASPRERISLANEHWAAQYLQCLEVSEAEVRDETFAHAYNVIKVLVLHAQRHACVRVMQAWMRWQRLAYESDRFWEQISGSICSLTTGLALRKVRAAWCAWNRYHRNHLALSQAASEKQARYEAVVSHTKVQLLRLLSGDRHRTNGNLRLAFAQLDFHRHRSVLHERHAETATAHRYAVIKALSRGHSNRSRSWLLSGWVAWKSVDVQLVHHQKLHAAVSQQCDDHLHKSRVSWAMRSLSSGKRRSKAVAWTTWRRHTLDAQAQDAVARRVRGVLMRHLRAADHHGSIHLRTAWARWKHADWAWTLSVKSSEERTSWALRSIFQFHRRLKRTAWHRWCVGHAHCASATMIEAAARETGMARIKATVSRFLRDDMHYAKVQLMVRWSQWKSMTARLTSASMKKAAARDAGMARVKATVSRFLRDDRHYANMQLLLRWAHWKSMAASRETGITRIRATVSRYLRDDRHYAKVQLLSRWAHWKSITARLTSASIVEASVRETGMARVKATVSRYLRDDQHYAKVQLLSRWAHWKSITARLGSASVMQAAVRETGMARVKATVLRYLRDDRHYAKVQLLSRWAHWKSKNAVARLAARTSLHAVEHDAGFARIKAIVSRYMRDDRFHSKVLFISRWSLWKANTNGMRIVDERRTRALKGMLSFKRRLVASAWARWEHQRDANVSASRAQDAVARRVRGVLMRHLRAFDHHGSFHLRSAWARWKHADWAWTLSMKSSEERVAWALRSLLRVQHGHKVSLWLRLSWLTWLYHTSRLREQDGLDILLQNQKRYDAEITRMDNAFTPIAQRLEKMERKFIIQTVRTYIDSQRRTAFSRWLQVPARTRGESGHEDQKPAAVWHRHRHHIAGMHRHHHHHSAESAAGPTSQHNPIAEGAGDSSSVMAGRRFGGGGGFLGAGEQPQPQQSRQPTRRAFP